MIIGFLGKGGSGKTSLATLWTKYLSHKDKGNFVLAIDNDHNMDLKYNLGYENDMNYIGQSLPEIFESIAIHSTKDVAKKDIQEYFFFLNDMDDISKKYSVKLSDNLFLMCAGPHTEDMMYGNSCSHSLTTPLKVYLPLLKVEDNEYVVVDEKAGTDGVGTGVTTGFNMAVVVAEATAHGIKSAKQIITMLRFYKTPFVIAINKIRDNADIELMDKEFENSGALDILHFNLDFDVLDLKSNDKYDIEFDKLLEISKKINDDRKERTRERILKQEEYNKSKSN